MKKILLKIQYAFLLEKILALIMNKITFYLIVFVMGFSYSYAQNQILSVDHFIGKRDGWSFENSPDSGKISESVLTLKNKNKKSKLIITKKYGFDSNSNFRLEAKIKLEKGSVKSGFGLFLSDTPKPNHTNWHYFLISGEQQYRIYYEGFKSRAPMDYKPWTRDSKAVNPRGEYNEIVIERVDDEIYFYINDKEVHIESSGQIGGKTVGLVLNNVMEVDIDYVKVHGMKRINTVANAKQGYKKIKLGSNVNTSYSDLLPIISYDGKTLYFVRKEDPGNFGLGDDIWVSHLNENNLWSEAKNIGKPLNNTGSNFVISVTPDGNTLLLGNTYNPDGSTLGTGISITNRIKGGWAVPTNVKIIDEYNNSMFVNYALSGDRKVLISSVQRDDTQGGSDLYVSFLNDSNHYSKPLNMGEVINTANSEGTPFIAADNKTIYFSSDGHTGYGSNDIFLSRRLDDTWTSWSEPENLGPDINSSGWDAYYALPAKGDYAFLVSDSDIYRMKVGESAKPEPVVLVYGKLVDQRKEPIQAKITYYDLETDDEIGTANSSPDDGSYRMVLPFGRKYRFTATGDYIEPITKTIDASYISTYEEVESNLSLKSNMPVSRGNAYSATDLRLNSVLFATNRSDLSVDATERLDKVIVKLKANPRLSVEIRGHTDSQGGASFNDRLAIARVKSVRRYLTTRGISAFRLIDVGYGEKDPVADNNTPEGRELNRRVEFKVVQY